MMQVTTISQTLKVKAKTLIPPSQKLLIQKARGLPAQCTTNSVQLHAAACPVCVCTCTTLAWSKIYLIPEAVWGALPALCRSTHVKVERLLSCCSTAGASTCSTLSSWSLCSRSKGSAVATLCTKRRVRRSGSCMCAVVSTHLLRDRDSRPVRWLRGIAAGVGSLTLRYCRLVGRFSRQRASLMGLYITSFVSPVCSSVAQPSVAHQAHNQPVESAERAQD